MSSSETPSKRQLSFAIAGVIFGFLMGYVVAHEVYGGRYGRTPISPEGPAPAMMGSGRLSNTPGGGMAIPGEEGEAPMMGGPGGSPEGGASMQTMEEVRRQLDELKAKLEQNPKDQETLTRLGGLYMDAGMYDRSVEYYRAAVEVAPEDVHLRTDLGASLMMQGKADEALKELETAVSLDPGHGKTWYTLGFALIQTGEYDRGEEAFAKALELNPGAFDMAHLREEIQKLKASRAEGRTGGSGS